jgi:hypothetical protein
MTRPSSITDAAPRTRTTPARIWAGLGVVFLAIQAWILGQWILVEGIHMTFDRNADISAGRAAAVWGVQGLTAALWIVVVVVLVRQCRRERRLTFDAVIAIGFTLCAWQDPLLEWFKPTFFHSYYSLQFNPNWGPYLPGWDHPGLHQPITLAVFPGVLAYTVMITCVWIQGWLTNWVAQRRPHWGTPRILAACLLAGLAVVVAFEAVAISTGIYTYPLAIQPLSLWGGHWYQYPVTEMISWALFLTAATMMRHKLYTQDITPHIFRGAEIRPGRRNTWIRLLAGIGFANVLMITYVITNAALSFLGGPIPADTPSYLWPR